jgi:hypothetical protein
MRNPGQLALVTKGFGCHNVHLPQSYSSRIFIARLTHHQTATLSRTYTEYVNTVYIPSCKEAPEAIFNIVK